MGVAVVLLIPRGLGVGAEDRHAGKGPRGCQGVKDEDEEGGWWISTPWVTGILEGT